MRHSSAWVAKYDGTYHLGTPPRGAGRLGTGTANPCWRIGQTGPSGPTSSTTPSLQGRLLDELWTGFAQALSSLPERRAGPAT